MRSSTRPLFRNAFCPKATDQQRSKLTKPNGLKLLVKSSSPIARLRPMPFCVWWKAAQAENVSTISKISFHVRSLSSGKAATKKSPALREKTSSSFFESSLLYHSSWQGFQDLGGRPGRQSSRRERPAETVAMASDGKSRLTR